MSRMRYFAHHIEEQPHSALWQRLEDHLTGVARLAAAFAEDFNSERWGYWVGLCHDLGKYQSEFQKKLRNHSVAVEHSGTGAFLAYQSDNMEGLPLAFVIAGHHTGLPNWSESGPNWPTPLKERLEENERSWAEVAPVVLSAISRAEIPPTPDFVKCPPDADRGQKKTIMRSMDLWIRFLFSCLVDADRLDTEVFLNPQISSQEGKCRPLAELRIRLDGFIAQVVSSVDDIERDSSINRIRRKTLDACQAASRDARGMYSVTSPAGSGKTLSTMSFAIEHAEVNGLKRVIVVMPHASLMEQNAQIYRNAFGAENIIEHHFNLEFHNEKHHHGEEQQLRRELACENWDAPIIITTDVQFFESLFSNQTSRCRKVHNMTNSVIILDEVQTVPPKCLPCVVDVLSELVNHYGCSVVLSSAMRSGLVAGEKFATGLENVREIIEEPVGLVGQLNRAAISWPGVEKRSAGWEAFAKELSGNDQFFVVPHRCLDARVLAKHLREEVDEESVLHLSDRMCPAHRFKVIEAVRDRLFRGMACRLVSTTLAEVGAQLDFPLVYRAIAGLDGILHASSHCNREGNVQQGKVVIFREPQTHLDGTLLKARQTTESMLRENGGALNSEDTAILEEYFRRFYRNSSQRKCEIQEERQALNFAKANDAFSLVEGGLSKILIVPYGEAPERMQHLREAQNPTRELLRQLQPYTVNTHHALFEKLDNKEMIEPLMYNLYTLSEAFTHLYTDQYGLVDEDDSFV